MSKPTIALVPGAWSRPLLAVSASVSTAVKAVAMIAGFRCPPGATMLCLAGGQLLSQIWSQQQNAIWKLKPQSCAVNTSPIPDQSAGLQGLPVSYLACKNDKAVPAEAFQGTIAGLQSMGLKVDVEYTDSGHSVFIKLPEQTAKFIRKPAGEDLTTSYATS